MTTTANNLFSERADKLSSLHKAMERKSSGDDLQILKHLLKAMGVATEALSLPKMGSAPLYIGLSAATIGIYSTESATGIIGPALAKILKAIDTVFSCAIMPEGGIGKQKFLMMLCLATYTSMTCLAAQASGQGVGRLPKNLEAADLKLARFFTFELALKLANSSLVLKEAFTVFIEACGGNKTAQRVGAAILAQIGQLFIILAGSKEAEKPANYLVADEGIYLRQGIQAAAEAVAKSESEGTVNTVVAVAINQLRIALDEHNETAFMEALNDLLESLDTSLEEVMIDLQEIQRFANMIINATSHSHNDESLTEIMNVI